MLSDTSNAGNAIDVAISELPISTATQSALDAKLDDSQLDTDGTLAANSDAKVASQKATKTYIDTQILTGASTPDATSLVKGKLKLTGDLGGTADSPTVPVVAGISYGADPVDSETVTTIAFPVKLGSGTNSKGLRVNDPNPIAGDIELETESTAGFANQSLNIVTKGTGTLKVNGVAVGTGSGSVTDVSVVSANGLAGTVATSTTTPALTLSTTVTGLLKGNGTAISAAVS